MLGDNVKAFHILLLLTVFWSAWLWTEVTEYLERQKVIEQMSDFVNKGDRFTKEDGDALIKRIERLEKGND